MRDHFVRAQSVQQGDQRVRDIVGAGKVRIGVFPSTQYSKDTKTGAWVGIAPMISDPQTSAMNPRCIEASQFSRSLAPTEAWFHTRLVRIWHEADIQVGPPHVRYQG